jgi:hypothetical protein
MSGGVQGSGIKEAKPPDNILFKKEKKCLMGVNVLKA